MPIYEFEVETRATIFIQAPDVNKASEYVRQQGEDYWYFKLETEDRLDLDVSVSWHYASAEYSSMEEADIGECDAYITENGSVFDNLEDYEEYKESLPVVVPNREPYIPSKEQMPLKPLGALPWEEYKFWYRIDEFTDEQ